MEASLRGSRALITGGTTGIGLAIAAALATEGVNIAVASRTPRPEALLSMRALGVNAQWIEADVSSEADVTQMFEAAQQAMAGLDLFINNAAGTWHQPITRLTADAWTQTLATNLSAFAFGLREAARVFINQERGCILAVGSTAAHVPLYREASYRTSKAGLKSLVELAAIELAPFGIRVNLLTPGAFLTSLTKDLPARQMDGSLIPLGRIGDTREIGHAAVFLLSEAMSSYITGIELVVDGGFRLRPMDLFSHSELRQMNQTTVEEPP